MGNKTVDDKVVTTSTGQVIYTVDITGAASEVQMDIADKIANKVLEGLTDKFEEEAVRRWIKRQMADQPEYCDQWNWLNAKLSELEDKKVKEALEIIQSILKKSGKL